jgi:hypothetical protein
MLNKQLLLQLAIATPLLLISQTNLASTVGRVTEQTGPTEIVRNKKSVASNVDSPVEMSDTVTTAKSRVTLSFEDQTTVKITEQSKLVIDDFVYDPNRGTGKLAVRVALGTAKYTSGQIAKNSPQSVNVKTPTATVAVRGTDFSMTVDELGRSLVVLLPSCNRGGCVTGAIEVFNEAGSVILDVAYQATLVTSLTTTPSAPVIINIDQNNINNMLIVSPPAEVKETVYHVDKTALDKNELDVDLLAFKELDKNELNDKKEIDRNDLEIDLLSFVETDELSAQNKTALGDAFEKNLLPNYNPATNLGYYFNDDKSKITLYRRPDHIAEVTFDTDRNAQLIINQDGAIVKQQVNQGGSTVINIKQTK